MSSNKLLSLAALAATLALPSASFATNGYFSHGYGIRNKALAGAGIAYAQDSLAIATNPSGLTDVGTRLDAGIDWFRPQRNASITGNAFGADQSFDGDDTKNFFIPEIGYSWQIDDRLAAGIAVYGNGGLNTDYGNNPYARFGAAGSAGVDLSQLFVTPAVAYRVAEGQSLGIGINFAYQRFKAKGLGIFGAFSADPNHVSDQGYDHSTGWGVRLGWTGHFTEFVTLGATWQSKTRMSKFDKYRGLFADQGSFDVPETYGLGLAVHPNRDLTFAFDWQKILYSKVPAVGNSVASLFSGSALGSSDGPGFGWRDVDVYKLGVSYAASTSITLRGGYSLARQPVPASETFFNILAPGVVQKHLTLGASWAVTPASELSVAYLHAFKHTVSGANSIPAGFPPSGLGGGNANIELTEDSLGVAYGLKF